jgi:hypothetical protein
LLCFTFSHRFVFKKGLLTQNNHFYPEQILQKIIFLMNSLGGKNCDGQLAKKIRCPKSPQKVRKIARRFDARGRAGKSVHAGRACL